MSDEEKDPAVEKRRERQRTINAYQRIFKSADGKLVLKDLAKAFGWDKPAFLNLTAGKGEIRFDPIHAAVRDGQRSIKLHIEAHLSAAVKGDANIKTAKPAIQTE